MVSESVLWRVTTRSVLFTIGTLLTLYLLYMLRAVVVQLLLAVIISAGITPIVDRLAPAIDPGTASATRRRQAPRALVVVFIYALLIGLMVLLGVVIIPPAILQVEDLARSLPQYASRVQEWVEGLPSRYPFLPAGVIDGLPDQLRGSVAQLSGVLTQALVVFQFFLGFLGGALNFIFILFLALYLTSDADRIRRYFITFLPPDRRPQFALVTEHIGERLGGWVRGQITLSAIIGAITLVGLLLIGVPYAVLLSLVAALGEAVPMVGPIFSAVPAVIVAFFVSPFHGFLTLGLYVIVQQVENAVVVPKVMERAVSLHPLAVMMALLIGSELYGVTGAILSVPVAAAISVVIHEVRREREARRQMEETKLASGNEAKTDPGAGSDHQAGAKQRDGDSPQPATSGDHPVGAKVSGHAE